MFRSQFYEAAAQLIPLLWIAAIFQARALSRVVSRYRNRSVRQSWREGGRGRLRALDVIIVRFGLVVITLTTGAAEILCLQALYNQENASDFSSMLIWTALGAGVLYVIVGTAKVLARRQEG